MIVYSGRTAWEFWQWIARTRSRFPETAYDLPKLPMESISLDEALLESEYFRKSGLIELLLSSDKFKHSPSKLRCVIRGCTFPNGSFCKLNSGIYVIAPRLLFLEYAFKHDLVETVYLGNRLASKFVIIDDENSKLMKCDPLLEIDDVKSFLDKMDGYPGIKTARRASRYIVNEAESPMEINVLMLLTLPRSLGGFGIPLPRMDYEIDVDKNQFPAYGKSSARFDMYWKQGALDVEYDSNQFHSNPKKLEADSIRRNVIKSMGYDVITVTSKEYRDLDSMIEIAQYISKKIGYRLRGLDIEWRSRAMMLVDKLSELSRNPFE